MDRIHIEDLHLRCIIGTNDWEREKSQDVLIGIILYTHTQQAGNSDDIADTTNYRKVAKEVIEHVEASQYFLVEALAENIAKLCLKSPGVEGVQVSVRKPGAIRFARSVGVTIMRGHTSED